MHIFAAQLDTKRFYENKRVNNSSAFLFFQEEYWRRGFQEVASPNIFNSKLWETSGHWQHYSENMFSFPVEGDVFALKPMNCPGHWWV